ncbi:MAG: hypothetical protein ACJ74D_11445 [Gaiellaceae bacterium]
MAKPKDPDKRAPDELTEQELAAANGEPLPDREAMSVIRGHETLPILLVPDETTMPIEDPHQS